MSMRIRNNAIFHGMLIAGITGLFVVKAIHLYYRLRQVFENPDYPGALKIEDYPNEIIYIGFGVSLAVLVLSGIWNFRVNDNLERADVRLHFSPGDSLKAWLVPVVNLYRPLFTMRESWQEMHAAAGEVMNMRAGIIPLWWTLRITGTVMATIFILYFKPESPLGADVMSVLLIALDLLLSLISLPLFLFIVLRMWRLERKLGTEKGA
jgi:hypothetical protein